MARICETCGENVIVGQGKWVHGAENGPNLVHKKQYLCTKARAEAERRRSLQPSRALFGSRKRASMGVDHG